MTTLSQAAGVPGGFINQLIADGALDRYLQEIMLLDDGAQPSAALVSCIRKSVGGPDWYGSAV